MKCQYCQAELEDGNPVCPACGKENPENTEKILTEEAPVEAAEAPGEEMENQAAPVEEAEEAPREQPAGKKRSAGKTAMLIGAAVVVLAVVVALIVSGMGGKKSAPSGTPGATVAADGKAGTVTEKGSYTVSDKKAAAKKDVVVGTIGNRELTNSELQIYYWMQVYAFLDEYGSYANYVGLDISKPFDTQMNPNAPEGDPSTWQQFFLRGALDAWQRYSALALEAESKGYELEDELKASLEKMPFDLEQLAKDRKFENTDALIQDTAGPGSDVQGYLDYMTTYNQGYTYFSAQYESFLPTAEEVDAYFTEHEKEYAEQKLTKDSGHTVDIRHILIEPEGGTEDENGNMVYTDEEWEACRVKAQGLLDQWLAGDKTEESFAKLASEHTMDPGSKASGGLYVQVGPGDMVDTFDAWCFEEGRQAGDYGLVKTKFGYHIMRLSGSQEMWYTQAESDIISRRSGELVEKVLETYPAEIRFDKIVLGEVKLTK